MKTEACVDQALACLAEAKADPARKDHWIDEAVIWMQRSIDNGGEHTGKSSRTPAASVGFTTFESHGRGNPC